MSNIRVLHVVDEEMPHQPFDNMNNYVDVSNTDIENEMKFFEAARNDDGVNSPNRYILQLWRANIDYQLVLMINIVLRYIGKCAMKVE